MSKKSHKALASATVMSLILTSTLTATVSAATGVERLSGSNRETTAIDVATKVFEKAETVVLVNGYKSADALSATPLAKAYNAPILSVGAVDEPTAALTKALADLGAKKVIVVGGEGAVTKALATKLAETYTVERIEGKDRYETNINVAKKVAELKDSKEAFVVNGSDASYADALSIASIAASKGAPIVFTNGKTVSDEAKALVKDLKVAAIGGTGVVSAEVLEAVNATRVGGADRFATNLEVLKAYKDVIKLDNVFVAYGLNFADALVASAAAAKTDAPVVLADKTNTKFTEGATDYIEANKEAIKNVYLVGGTGVISDSVKGRIDAIVNPVIGDLAVASLEAINAKEIEIVFNKNVDKGSAENADNYQVKVGGSDVTGFTVTQDEDNKKKIVIELDDADAIQAITSVEVKVKKDLLAEDFTALKEDYKKAFVFYDDAAPEITKTEVDGETLTVTFNEHVSALPLMKVNGKVVTTTTSLPAKEIEIDLSDLGLEDGTYTFTAANVADMQDTPNVAGYLSKTFRISDTDEAPVVEKIVAKTAYTFEVTFSKALKANPTIVAKKDGADVFSGMSTTDSKKYTVTVADVEDVVDIYEDDATIANLAVTISGYQASSNNLYGDKVTRTVKLSKDEKGPVLVQGYSKVVDGNAFELRFDEEIVLSDSFGNSDITVVDQDGVRLSGKVNYAITVEEDSEEEDKILRIDLDDATDAALNDGTYTITIAKGAIEDLSGNGNLAITTTVKKSASGSDMSSVAVSGTNNVITITYADEMTSTAISAANYKLDSAALPSGTVLYFADEDKTTVTIELPTGSVDSDADRVLTISTNVVAKNGNTIAKADRNHVVDGFADNVKPVLASAKKTNKTTITLKFNEDMEADIVSSEDYTNDFKVKVNGVEITVSDVANGDKADEIVLTVAEYNVNQSVTVETVKTGLTLKDASGNNAVKAQVSVTATK